MGQTREQRVIKQLTGDSHIQKQTPIMTDMFLPNHSGISSHPEFKRAIVESDPVAMAYLNQNVKTTSSPTFANITDTGLTANKFVFTSAGKVLTSTVPASIINDILPSQSGCDNLFLQTNGTDVQWASAGGGCSANMEYKGTWDVGTTYEPCDVVIHGCTYGGSRIFLSLTCACGNDPNCECECSPSNWQLLTRNILSEDPSNCVQLTNESPTCYHYGCSGNDFLGTPEKWLRYYYYGSCEGEFAIPLYRVPAP